MKILSVGDYYSEVNDSPPVLKQLLKDELGKSFRRIDRFIQLALIGVNRCVKSQTLSPQTSVYLTSGQGDLDITIDVLERIYQHGEAPKPLSFINTVSNAACFNIANHLELTGKSSFVTGHYFSFERSLELAYRDYCSGNINSALVGSVDICAQPLLQHRERIGIDDQCAIGEGSHWWLVGDKSDSAPAIAELSDIKHFCDEEEILDWLGALDIRENVFITRGQYLDNELFEKFKTRSGIRKSFSYCDDLAFYNTQSGSVLSHFIRQNKEGTLIHINADPDKRFCVFCLDISNNQ